VFCTSSSYEVTPAMAFHVYVGVSVVTLPLGDTSVGVPGNVGLGINGTLTGPRGNQLSGGASDNRTTPAP